MIICVMFPRLHPATGWPRLLTKDVVLSGYKVPSGVSVISFLSIYSCRVSLALNLNVLCCKCKMMSDGMVPVCSCHSSNISLF